MTPLEAAAQRGLSRMNKEIIIDNIPYCLRERPQWVCWRQEQRNGRPTKVPYDVKTGRKASSAGPATWTTFEEAYDVC